MCGAQSLRKASCGNGECCSQYGYCGTALSWCGAGCQKNFGVCNVSKSRVKKNAKEKRIVWTYPKVRRNSSVIEELHGIRVADPYRWLEDPDSAETKAFVEDQNAITNKYLESYPDREKFRQSLTTIYNYEIYGCPFKEGDFYYYFYNTGLQAQSVLYQQSSLTAEPKIFFDPNTLETDGTASLSSFSFSKSGKLFAYGISKSGSDWITVYIKPTTGIESNQHLDDLLEWVKFSGFSFTHDDAGFFYNQYPKPEKTEDKGTETDSNLNAKIYYHKVGTQQVEDILVYQDPTNPEYFLNGEVSEDGQYLLLNILKDTSPVNKFWIADLQKTGGKVTTDLGFVKIVDNFDAEYSYIINQGSKFYFKTNLNAPRYKIITYDIEQPDQGFAELIPQHPVDILSFVKLVHQTNLITIYMHDAKEQLSIHDLSTGKLLRELDLPIGSIESLAGRDTEFFFKFTGFLNPGVIYRYNLLDYSMSVFRTTQIQGLDAENLETKQVFVKSKDGTKIPAFIISRKNITLDGKNPTHLYGYGGFGISQTPIFSPTWINFVQHYDGVVVVANIRGGGEYGEDWHAAGTLHKKQNVFDDFQAVAKWLIANKYTKSEKLSINGGSNGGLLVGACINQAPELFGAAVADVGVMDMLRFHKFTIGHAWRSDYGDPDKKEDFEYIYKYSPLHNVQSEKPYPAVMLVTSDHDDRVVPLHSYKYIAQLQYVAKDNPKPLLLRVETKAGHGAGKPTKKQIEEQTDQFTFISLATGAQWHD
ncbi:hypothetical protein G9A89_001005 [Geosiphon pyriformis]|nr:hypothetical protein G9A89_001005 [Geosiphon pyriformis]